MEKNIEFIGKYENTTECWIIKNGVNTDQNL